MYDQRIAEVRKELAKKRLDAALITSFANILYLTGFSSFLSAEREAYLLVSQAGNFFLTHSIYSRVLKEKMPGFEVIEISRRQAPQKALVALLGKKDIKLGIEENNLTVSEYKSLQKTFDLKNLTISLHRSIKLKSEIELIGEACHLADQAFEEILAKIKLGITELELAYQIDNFIRSKGFEPAFKTIVAFGKNAASPHHISGQTKLEKNQFVLLDFGANFKGYCSDMTRTVFFGSSDREQEKLYQTVLASQQKAVSFIQDKLRTKDVILASAVDQIARKTIQGQNYPDFPHSLGHGIGLEVHERPYLSAQSKDKLVEGVVFSIEPGIYLLDSVGVRIEDLYAIEEGELQVLTQARQDLINLR